MVRFIENIVITIDVFLLLGSEIYLFWKGAPFSLSGVKSPQPSDTLFDFLR